MADESSDISSVEQFVIFICWVDNMLEPHEDFIALHTINISNTKNLSLMLKDITLKFGLNRELLREQRYDRYSTVMGKVSGVAQINKGNKQGINHRGFVVHCFCHSLRLACGNNTKNCTLMNNSLDTSFEIAKLVNLKSRI